MNASQREELIYWVEKQRGRRREVLKNMGIPAATYYKWRTMYQQNGKDGFKKSSPAANRVWNRLTPAEKDGILSIARQPPELSSRLLAIKIIDEESFRVSEPTVYRLLKEQGLVCPRPLPEMPAAKEWRHKTKRPDEIWQCDGTKLFIVG